MVTIIVTLSAIFRSQDAGHPAAPQFGICTWGKKKALRRKQEKRKVVLKNWNWRYDMPPSLEANNISQYNNDKVVDKSWGKEIFNPYS